VRLYTPRFLVSIGDAFGSLYLKRWHAFRACFIAIVLLLLLLPSHSTLHAQTTTGRDFWMGFMYNDSAVNKPIKLTIYLSAVGNTQGTVSIPGQNWSQEFLVSSGKGTVVTIPSNLGMALTSETIEPKAIHIEAKDSIACFALNYSAQTADASVILPTKTLGKEYRIIAYTATNYPSELLVVAVEDNTSVEITPTATTSTGNVKDVPFRITLARGEEYQVQSMGDLTGTRIIATKGVAVYGGSACASIPAGVDYSDHLYEQMYPLTAWGKNYITVPLKTRKGDTFRMLASEDNTTLQIDSLPIVKLHAGQFYETILKAPSTISATKPIAVAQYSNSSQYDKVEESDPFMIILSPNEQMQSRVTFNAFVSEVITSYYLNIITQSADVSRLKFDNAAINGVFKPVPTDPRYSYAAMKITAGDHTLFSPGGFIAYVYGYGNAESYGYSAGASIKSIQHFALITGKVLNKKTGLPVSAQIIYELLPSGKQAGTVRSNPTTGEYTAVLPVGPRYGVRAEAPGYYAVSDNLDASDTADDSRVTKELELVPIEVGQVVRLNNVFFDVNLSVLRSESFPELDRIVKLMKENSGIVIAISGHTDNVGSDEINLALSEARAKAVATYLTQAGIDPSRVSSKGYGKTKPIANNDTEEGKQQNRRVEFSIVK
jgi:outer membrane protein OmpA-like peptidoglycan-associated protein